jgi:hypothetical protein
MQVRSPIERHGMWQVFELLELLASVLAPFTLIATEQNVRIHLDTHGGKRSLKWLLFTK